MERARGFYLSGLHYRREWVRCGKPACKSCPHGPYWYCYGVSGIFLKKRYVGKNLPAEVRAYAPAWAQ
jgi:elongation factor P hydroxylase